MAAVSVLRSPHNLDDMASRRAPLSTLPHATNSPLRHQTVGKRTRTEATNAFDDFHAPPTKRHHLVHERDDQDRENVPPQPQTPHKKKAVSSLDARLAKHALQLPLIDRERATRLVISKERVKEAPVEAGRRDKQRLAESRLDDLSRWQRYYERQFPNFVFYFENISEEARRQCSRQVRELGAREDRFFSRAVTHVITTRSMPTEASTAQDDQQVASAEEAAHHNGTINPSLLDRRHRIGDELGGSGRHKFNFDAALSKKAMLGVSPEKVNGRNNSKGDVLLKAKDLNIKIWQLEKLQRILRVMYADDEATEPTEQESHRHGKAGKQTNLSQLIKNEERSQAGAREIGPLQGELIPLNEPYIFVRCYNEKTKPLMVRQFQKVSKAEDGDWPQFRAVTQGKCPFVPEEPRRKPATEKVVEQVVKKQEKAVQRAMGAQVTADAPQQRRSNKRTYDDLDKDDRHEDDVRRLPFNLDNYLAQVQELEDMKDRRFKAEKAQLHEDGVFEDEADENKDQVTQKEEQQETDNAKAEDATTDAAQITPPLTTESAVMPSKGELHNFAAHSRQNSFDLMAPPAALPRPNPRMGLPGGEPLASGLQKSGMTSAIRSQMISSTAAGPGFKAGTSKDIHSLQRRILERNSTGSGSTLGMSAPANATSTAAGSHPGKGNVAPSRGLADAAGRVRAENPRAAKIKAVEKINMHGRGDDRMGIVAERDEGTKRRGEDQDRVKPRLRKEPKPGYCENCREKFDDFDVSRKHRKFAQTKENWTDLDNLLAQLQRPLKLNKRKRDEYEGAPTSSEDERLE